MTATIEKVGTVDGLRARHRQTEDAKAAAHAAVTTAEARVNEFARRLGQRTDSQSPTPAEMYEARAERPDAERTLYLAQLDAEKADEAETAARAAVKAAAAVEIHGLMRPRVKRSAELFALLRVEMDAVAALEDRMRNECGGGSIADTIVWPSVMTGNARFEPLLDFWLARVREYGLLDG